VKSPLGGQVVTWDLKNRLPIGRPVNRGQVLLCVADPDGPWQLELHMPEHRVGHVVQQQQAKYDESRMRLRELLAENARAKLGDAASQDEVDKMADAELATVIDENLHDRIVAEFRRRLGKQIETIVNDATDAEMRAKLGAVLRDESYDGARAKLDALLPEVKEKDADLYAKLSEVPREEVPNDRLRVAYILATEPGTTHYGTVKEIHRSAEVRPDEGNTVLIKVAIDKQDVLDLLRPGATVTAQVDCGRRPLGYVLLHDVFDFVQSRVLFRYF
jgi:hypothetical protein